MASLPTIAFVLVAASLFGAGVEAKKPCVSYIINDNLYNATVDEYWMRKVVKSTLESKVFCKPTPLIKILWDCILDMVDSKHYYLQRVAYIYAVRASLLLTTYNTDLNFCVVAEGITAAVNYKDSENTEVIASSLTNFGESIRYSREIFTRAALSVANCKNIDPPKLTPPSCPDNGLVDYPIKKMWKLFGQMLPCCLKEAVFNLYKCDNPLEQAHAVVVTSILSDYLEEVFVNICQKPTYESLYLLSIVKIQKCCCDERKEFLEQVTEERATTINQEIVKLIEEKYAC